MKDEILQQAKVLESNLKILNETLQRVEWGSIRMWFYSDRHNGKLEWADIKNALGESYATVDAVTTMLMKQILQTKIEETQAALDAL